MNKLPHDFFLQKNVLVIAKALLGKLLVTQFENELTISRIVEVEAYNGIHDKASHTYGNKRTQRTTVMYANGGVAYVYLCYGIHHLFNVVTNIEGIPHAVLIRAVEPVKGIEIMLKRMKKEKLDFTIGRGPGNVAKAMGISTKHTGLSLLNNEIFIADDGMKLQQNEFIITPRIGVDYAAEDALLPYRFYIKNNNYVSGKK